nr:MAG TPA: hypothetical protein [Caudoviricetes sp.]DAX52700.1 MAG TPA: hypothetical protein [Caudoviricetes sp.]
MCSWSFPKSDRKTATQATQLLQVDDKHIRAHTRPLQPCI